MPRIVCSWCLLLMSISPSFLLPPCELWTFHFYPHFMHIFPYPIVVNDIDGMSYILLYGTVWRHEDEYSFQEHCFQGLQHNVKSATQLWCSRSAYVQIIWILLLLLIILSVNNKIWTDTAYSLREKVQPLSRWSKCYLL